MQLAFEAGLGTIADAVGVSKDDMKDVIAAPGKAVPKQQRTKSIKSIEGVEAATAVPPSLTMNLLFGYIAVSVTLPVADLMQDGQLSFRRFGNFEEVHAKLRAGGLGFRVITDLGRSPVNRESGFEPVTGAEVEFDCLDAIEARTIGVLTKIDELVVASGVSVVIGTTDQAKSPLAAAFAAGRGGKLLEFGEPVGAGSTTSSRRAAIRLLAALLSSDVDMIALDSVKNLVSRTPEGAGSMTKGSSRDLLPMLSDWSSLAIFLNKSVFTIVNIGTDDVTANNEYVTALRTNITQMFVCQQAKGVFEATTRVKKNAPRVTQMVRLKFGAEGSVPRILCSDSVGVKLESRPEVSSVFYAHKLNVDSQFIPNSDIQRATTFLESNQAGPVPDMSGVRSAITPLAESTRTISDLERASRSLLKASKRNNRS